MACEQSGIGKQCPVVTKKFKMTEWFKKQTNMRQIRSILTFILCLVPTKKDPNIENHAETKITVFKQ